MGVLKTSIGGTVDAVAALATSATLKKKAGPRYPMAWQGMALNLPLMTAYLMKDSIPDRGIPIGFHT